MVLFDTSEAINPYLTKTGTTNSSAGAQITYEIAHGNVGTDELTLYKVTDALPEQVNITTVACTLNQTQIPSYSLYITTRSDEETEILILENATEDSEKIDLTSYLKEGDTVASVIFVGASCSATTVTDYSKIYLYGSVLDSVEEETTILNIAKTDVTGESGTVGRNIGFYTTVETSETAPTIFAEDLKIGLNSEFDPLSGVSATDSEGNDITSSILVVYNTVNTSVIGDYEVTYQVHDSLDKTAEKTISVTVFEEESTSPIIIAENLEIGLNSEFDPLSGVSATDSEGNDLTSSIVVTYNGVDTAVAGDYKVTYEVTDALGETTEKTILVTVAEEEETTMEQAITDVIGSVALEEAAIYGILDAEGAKIQKAVALDLTNEELLAVNSSVESMIESLTSLELVLLEKLNIVTSAT